MADNKTYVQFPTHSTPSPSSSTPSFHNVLSAPAPQTNMNVSDTKDKYCLYTTQGQIICNKRTENLPIAPWGLESQTS